MNGNGRRHHSFRGNTKCFSFGAAFLAAWLLGVQSRSAPSDPPPPLSVTLGIQNSPAMGLVMVAQDRGFFDKAGVHVEIKEFSAGKFALQAMLGGSVDFAVAGEVPIALAAIQGNEVRAFAQVVRNTRNEVRMVVRHDGPLDPKTYFTQHKRRVATSLGGGPEFFTWSFLKALDVPPGAVEIVGQRPEDMPAALASYSVDAISIFDPFAYIAEKLLGSAAQTLVDSSGYSELYVLAANPAVARSRSREIERMIAALVEASAAIKSDPKQARGIVAKYTHLNENVVDGIWSNFEFAPALTPQLLAYWQRELVWARETGKVDVNRAAPDFVNMIDASALRRIAPETVTLK